VSNAVGHDAPSVLNIERLMLIKKVIDKLDHFVKPAYSSDVSAIGAL
jgi:hydrogenase large subunit